MDGIIQNTFRFGNTRIQRRMLRIDPTGTLQDSIKASLLHFIKHSPKDLDYGIYHTPQKDKPWLQKVLCHDARLGTAVYLNTTYIRQLGIIVDIFGYRSAIYFVIDDSRGNMDGGSLSNPWAGHSIYDCDLEDELLQQLEELFGYHKQPVFLWSASIGTPGDNNDPCIPLRMIDSICPNDPTIAIIEQVVNNFLANYTGGQIYRGTLTRINDQGRQRIFVYNAGYLGSMYDRHWWYLADTIFITDGNLMIQTHKHPKLLFSLDNLQIFDTLNKLIPVI